MKQTVDTLIGDVSDTAFWIAYFRSVESRRADALFHDPLAGLLAGDRGRAIAERMPRSFITAWTVAIRTCIIDAYIRTALKEGVDTILNLGAGLDTRPYRMDLPYKLVWIEADYPKMIEYKEKALRKSRIRQRCRLERVKLDLTNHSERGEALEKARAQGNRMLVLTEGVVPYLSADEVGSLADDLKALDHAYYWIVDYFSPETRKFRKRFGISRRMKNAPFKFAPKDWFGFFDRHGWKCREICYFSDAAEILDRPVEMPPLVRLIVKIRRAFASEARRKTLRELAGYVMLEPASVNAQNAAHAQQAVTLT